MGAQTKWDKICVPSSDRLRDFTAKVGANNTSIIVQVRINLNVLRIWTAKGRTDLEVGTHSTPEFDFDRRIPRTPHYPIALIYPTPSESR